MVTRRNEPDSRQEIVFADLKGKSDEELREMVREEMRLLGELNDNPIEHVPNS